METKTCSSCKYFYIGSGSSHSVCVVDGAPFKVVRSCFSSCPKYRNHKK